MFQNGVQARIKRETNVGVNILGSSSFAVDVVLAFELSGLWFTQFRRRLIVDRTISKAHVQSINLRATNLQESRERRQLLPDRVLGGWVSTIDVLKRL